MQYKNLPPLDYISMQYRNLLPLDYIRMQYRNLYPLDYISRQYRNLYPLDYISMQYSWIISACNTGICLPSSISECNTRICPSPNYIRMQYRNLFLSDRVTGNTEMGHIPRHNHNFSHLVRSENDNQVYEYGCDVFHQISITKGKWSDPRFKPSSFKVMTLRAQFMPHCLGK